MSMTSITLICRPTRDPELKSSPSGVIFTTLDVAVTKGFGDKEHPNYFRAYCKNDMAQRVINAGVKKGSLIYIIPVTWISALLPERMDRQALQMRLPYSIGGMSIPANRNRKMVPRHRMAHRQHRTIRLRLLPLRLRSTIPM